MRLRTKNPGEDALSKNQNLATVAMIAGVLSAGWLLSQAQPASPTSEVSPTASTVPAPASRAPVTATLPAPTEEDEPVVGVIHQLADLDGSGWVQCLFAEQGGDEVDGYFGDTHWSGPWLTATIARAEATFAISAEADDDSDEEPDPYAVVMVSGAHPGMQGSCIVVPPWKVTVTAQLTTAEGAPHEGAAISLCGREGTTDSLGRFSVQEWAHRSCSVSARGYGLRQGSGAIEAFVMTHAGDRDTTIDLTTGPSERPKISSPGQLLGDFDEEQAGDFGTNSYDVVLEDPDLPEAARAVVEAWRDRRQAADDEFAAIMERIRPRE